MRVFCRFAFGVIFISLYSTVRYRTYGVQKNLFCTLNFFTEMQPAIKKKMIFYLLQIVLLTIITSTTFAQETQTLIPLSSTGYAFQRGNPASNVVVDLYIDLTCSDCLSAWPNLTQIVETYEHAVNFLYRIFPLPYHQQAFILSKAASCVYHFVPNSIFTFMDTAFANQGDIYTSVTANMTYTEVVGMVELWATNGTGLTSEQYKIGMNSSTPEGETIEMNARYMFKFSTLHRAYGTPEYMINGLVVDGLDSIEAWSNTLDPLIHQGEMSYRY